MKIIRTFLFMMVFFLNTIPSSAQSNTETAENTTAKTIKVKGITCSTDIKMITTNVEKLPGIVSCNPGKLGPTTTFEVTFKPTLVNEQAIFTAIENTASCENPADRPYHVKK